MFNIASGLTALSLLCVTGMVSSFGQTHSPIVCWGISTKQWDGVTSASRIELTLLLVIPLVALATLIERIHMARRNNKSVSLLNAAFLFYVFMSSHDAEAFTGDLEEGYKALHKKFGRRRANLWYWFQTFISLRPIVCEALMKTLMKPLIGVIGWALAKDLIKHDGWLAALVELWKKIAGA